MIKFEKTEVVGWEHAIRGMRNPMNSWDKGDSGYCAGRGPRCKTCPCDPGVYNPCHFANMHKDKLFIIGPNDFDLMKRLRNAGTDHRKFMRMINIYVDITAPLYWWKEFDTYRVGTVINSCSTMHKIHAKEFTLDDFSHEHLIDDIFEPHPYNSDIKETWNYKQVLEYNIKCLNNAREWFLETKDKKYWWQMIQLLPSSYNQKRTIMMSYEVAANAYNSRDFHKLDEWAKHKEKLYNTDIEESYIESIKGQFGFCDWINTLPYSELITGDFKD